MKKGPLRLWVPEKFVKVVRARQAEEPRKNMQEVLDDIAKREFDLIEKAKKAFNFPRL